MKKIVILLLIGIIGIDASHKMSQEITNSNRKESDKERLYAAQFALIAAFYLAYFGSDDCSNNRAYHQKFRYMPCIQYTKQAINWCT